MTDDTELTIQDVKDFVKAKYKTSCPICRAQMWNLELREGQKPFVSVIHEGKTKIDGIGGYSTVLLNCNNCGFVVQHLRSVIQEWIKNEYDALGSRIE